MAIETTVVFIGPELLVPGTDQLLHCTLKKLSDTCHVENFCRPTLNEQKILGIFPGMSLQMQVEVFKYLFGKIVLVVGLKGESAIRLIEQKVGTDRDPTKCSVNSIRYYLHSQLNYEPTAFLEDGSMFYRYHIGVARTYQEVEVWRKILLNGSYTLV